MKLAMKLVAAVFCASIGIGMHGAAAFQPPTPRFRPPTALASYLDTLQPPAPGCPHAAAATAAAPPPATNYATMTDTTYDPVRAELKLLMNNPSWDDGYVRLRSISTFTTTRPPPPRHHRQIAGAPLPPPRVALQRHLRRRDGNWRLERRRDALRH